MSPTEHAGRVNAKMARRPTMARMKMTPQSAAPGALRQVDTAPAMAERRLRARMTAARANEPTAKTDNDQWSQPRNQIPTAHQATDPAQAMAASSIGSALLHSSRRTQTRPGSTNVKAASGHPIAGKRVKDARTRAGRSLRLARDKALRHQGKQLTPAD